MTDARDDPVARVLRRLEQVIDRIESTGREPTSVRIVAVIKGFGADGAVLAAAAGLHDVAENYAAALVEAHDALAATPLTWHFLGALQRNKLPRLAGRVDCYQSVAAVHDVAALSARAPGARCYVQVNVSEAPGRGGCAPGDEGAIVGAARDAGLEVEGLMCVATADPALAGGQFASLRRSADALGLVGCSMGMSGDLEAACAAGSTMLRLGTALLGPRASRGPTTVA